MNKMSETWYNVVYVVYFYNYVHWTDFPSKSDVQ